MSSVGNMNSVPLFVKAKKPEQLIVEMHRNNTKRGKQYDYKIVHDGKLWYAWYTADLLEELKAQRNERKRVTNGSDRSKD